MVCQRREVTAFSAAAELGCSARKSEAAVAVNQVSLSFYTPRWKQRLTPHPNAISDEGTAVQVIDAVPAKTGNAAPLSPGFVRSCLTERGFEPAQWGQGNIFERGKINSIFGPEKAIQVSVGGRAIA
jgi:hypothetical protein